MKPMTGLNRRFVAFAASVFALIIASTANCLAGGPYCAIAISQSHPHHWGASTNKHSYVSVVQHALADVATADAKVVGWYCNGWVALAQGPGSAWGCGTGPDRRTAEVLALRPCGENCRIVKEVYAFQ